MLAIAQAGHENNRQQPRVWPLLDLRAQLEAVDSRHFDVEQHEIGFASLEDDEGLLAVGRGVGFVAVFREYPDEEAAVCGFIVHDEHPPALLG